MPLENTSHRWVTLLLVHKFGVTAVLESIQVQRHQIPGKLSEQQVTPRALNSTVSPALPKSKLLDENQVSSTLPTVDLVWNRLGTKDEGATPTCTTRRASRTELWAAWASGQAEARHPMGQKAQRQPTGWHPRRWSTRSQCRRTSTEPSESPGQPDMSQEGAGAAEHPSAQPN